jgi:hypothetical protein
MTLDREALQVTRSLELAVTYTREVRAGVERIWENVFDWEHLPVLHETYFNAVELIETGDWGWRVALTKNPGTEDRRMVLECGPTGRMSGTVSKRSPETAREQTFGHC